LERGVNFFVSIKAIFALGNGLVKIAANPRVVKCLATLRVFVAENESKNSKKVSNDEKLYRTLVVHVDESLSSSPIPLLQPGLIAGSARLPDGNQ